MLVVVLLFSSKIIKNEVDILLNDFAFMAWPSFTNTLYLIFQ